RPRKPTCVPYTTLFRSALVAEDIRQGCEHLRASDEQLAEIGRTVSAIEPAAQTVLGRDAPVDERLVRLEVVDLRHAPVRDAAAEDRKSTRLNSSHVKIS